MKLLKIAGFLALGVAAIAAGLFVFGLITSLLHIVIPLAILAGVGWLVWNVFFSGKSAPKQDEKKPEPQAQKQVEAPPERKALTTEEAARIFEEQKKNLQ